MCQQGCWWLGRVLSEGTAVSGVCPNPGTASYWEGGARRVWQGPLSWCKVSHGMKAVVDQQSLPAWKMGALPQSGGGHRAAAASQGHWARWEPLWSHSLGAVACWGSLDAYREGHSWPFMSYFPYSLAVNSQKIFFMIFCLIIYCCNVCFVLYSFFQWIFTFSFQTQVGNLLFSMNSILPYTYSEFHLPASPSQKVSLHLVSIDNQPALSSTVHCLFSRCLVIVQHGKPQCILYVWTPKALLQSDPRASSLCLSLALLHAPTFPQISL